MLSVRSFDEDKCLLRASALTFYSLLSIVPVVAMAFGIAKGFGFEKLLEKFLIEQLQGQEEAANRIIMFAQSLLENTRGGVIAGIGVAVLFWTVIKLLGNIEKSFNDIWGIKKSRSFGRKFSDYLSAMLICPVLLIMSSSATVALTGQIKVIVSKISLLGLFSPLIFAVLKLMPFGIVWIVFTFLYIFMPNNKISFKSGLLAGIIAGTLYQLLQGTYINFQVGMAKYNAIYGSFAALPLFLLWLQISWLIVLLGAEISFAHQNVDTYEFEPDYLRISYSFKKTLTLMIVHLMVKKFSSRECPLTAPQISHTLEIPIRLVHQILYELVQSGILVEVALSDDENIGYQPAQSIEKFTIKYIIDTLENHGSDNIPIVSSRELDRITECLKDFGDKMEKSSANVTLRDV